MKKENLNCHKAVIILVVSLLLLFLTVCLYGCTERYDYPDGLTNEYFYTNYVQMDYNYMFSSIYVNKANKAPYSINPRWYWFYAIRDVSIDDYIACQCMFVGVGSNSKYMVYARTESQSDLIGTYGINRMSIILKSRLDDDVIDAMKTYEKSTLASNLNTTEDKSICNLLQQNISNKDGYVKMERYPSGDRGPGEYLYCTNEEYLNTLLYIRLYTSETSSVFWESNVVLYEGRYCLASYLDEYRHHYALIPLSNEVSDYIKNVVEQSGYSFAYERIDR